ncbi:sensor histidine kinase [Clostridium sp. Marseille-P299]|uniref:sensor histidine kinase n=1 Tax=Clostridium sp. Marseille-P299 TaxID=1805477 RepID=UPI0009EE9D7B|nr:sensor histidine kinase [Clostridium sp. Marseille-P299]
MNALNIVYQLLFIVGYTYFLYQMGEIEKGKGKLSILCFLSVSSVVVANVLGYSFVGWLLVTLFFVLYDLFFDEEIFQFQWKYIVLYGGIILVYQLLEGIHPIFTKQILMEFLCLFLFFIFSWKRSYLRIFNAFIVTVVYACIIMITFLINKNGSEIFRNDTYLRITQLWLSGLSLLIFIMLELTLRFYKTGFEKSMRSFQQNLLQHQYEEIKNIYLDMRGWRHDYHNHIQVIKAHIALMQIEEVNTYLDKLEQELSHVDTFVKSGNLMIDAILNSKLSLAEKKNIKINCKAEVKEDLSVSEIDLCVILGNLLDNAIESCERIEEDKRFIRVYIAIIKKQLYLSIQNSAKEDLSVNDKNYITTKRGNHGLGLKRVKILTEKYDGYLNLQNEPGIFASEVTIPL